MTILTLVTCTREQQHDIERTHLRPRVETCIIALA